jgi:hypothetical protein
VDNVDNRVSKKDLSMEECQQMVKWKRTKSLYRKIKIE